MRDIVKKGTKPGNLVMNAFAGTISFAMTCTLLPKHGRLLGCDVDPSCVAEEIPQWILLYARQVLRQASNSDEKEEARESAEMYVKAVEALEMRKRLDV